MAVRQTLVGLDSADLIEIRDACKAAIVAGAVRGINYTIAGRSFGFASMAEVSNVLQEAIYALGLLTGARAEAVRSNFNRGFNRQ